ncbi:MAG: hypothetical protein ACK54H_11435 [Phycisphaerales bacterium]
MNVIRRSISVLVLASGSLSGCETNSVASKPQPSPSKPVITAPSAISGESNTAPVTTESWTFGDAQGVVLSSENYRIFTTSTRRTLLDRLPVFMESALRHYRSALGDLPEPRSELETYLLANRPQWTRMTQQLMGADADIYLNIQRGGFSSDGRAVLYEIGPYDTYSIAAHEGWHQYTQRSFKEPLPVWLEEGLACYMEGFRWSTSSGSPSPTFLPWANFERFDELRDAFVRDRMMPLTDIVRRTPQELMAQDPSLALTYYAQLWGLVHFLNEAENGAHREQLRILIADASKGRIAARLTAQFGPRAGGAFTMRRPVPQLLESYFQTDAAAMDARYRAFVANITRTGAKQFIAAGKSPYAK